MINYTQAFDNSRMAIARLRSLEQFTEDDAINIFKKALGCNGKQAKKAWKKLKDKKKGGVIDLGNGLFRLRNEDEIDLENNKGLTEIVDVAFHPANTAICLLICLSKYFFGFNLHSSYLLWQ